VELTATPGQTETLANAIRDIYESDELEFKEDTSVKVAAISDKVYVSIKGSPDSEANYMEPFNMFYAQGTEAQCIVRS
jgi:hypothetical protein